VSLALANSDRRANYDEDVLDTYEDLKNDRYTDETVYRENAEAVIAGGLVWPNQHIDWLGLQAQPALRAMLLLAVVAATIIVYFVVLFCLGFRPRDFRRRSDTHQD